MSKKRQPPERHDSSDDDRIVTAVATVTHVASLVGLSRERFYQLIKAGSFPAPQRPEGMARPCYTEEQQRACLAVRRTGVGVNGRPVLFNRRFARRHAKRVEAQEQAAVQPTPATSSSDVSLLVDGVRALGLDATAEQVEAARRACFPDGTDVPDDGAVVAAVFRHLYQQQRRGKV